MKIRYFNYALALIIAMASKLILNAGYTAWSFITVGIAIAIIGGSYLIARYCDRRFNNEN